ncbi:MAG: DUF1697 domain-containing protein [Ilumatobacteraceae bacterium]
MTTRIAFLRAVNLGRRTVPMARLVETCAGLGYDDVWTFANSGNVVFSATGRRADIERTMEESLASAFGFEVTTFARTAAELRTALALRPFELATGDTYFVTFLKDVPSAATARALESASNEFDTLVVDGRDVHWRMRGKSTDTTLTRATWNLVGERRSTSRNVNLLGRIAAKLAG